MPHHSGAMSETPRPSVTPAAASGRWFLALLGLSIALVGAVFVFLMARSFLRALEMRDWPRVECVILISEVTEWKHDEFSATQYRHDITYGYTWNGEALTSGRIGLRGNPWSSSREKAAKSVAAYPPCTTATCLVNPAEPSIAVLKPDSLAPGYSIWFPGLFVVGGLGIAVRALRQRGN